MPKDDNYKGAPYIKKYHKEVPKQRLLKQYEIPKLEKRLERTPYKSAKEWMNQA